MEHLFLCSKNNFNLFLKIICYEYFIKSLNITTFARLFLVNNLLMYKNYLFYT